MKRIYVLRHAKSSWDEPDLADFDRPLNERGKKAAPFMGELMKNRDHRPQVILSSPAKRARDTAEMVKNAGHLSAEVRLDDRIYEASPYSLSKVVTELEDLFDAAMIVGHNPGIEGFVNYLTGKSTSMPTASLAVIDLEIDNWSETKTQCGSLVEVIRPREANLTST